MTHGPNTGPAGQSPPAHERAETFLRLQAEAELRAALGYRRYVPPRQHRLPGALRIAVLPLRGPAGAARRATVRSIARPHPAAQAASGAGAGPAARGGTGAAVLRAASRVWQVLNPAWQRVVFWSWRASRRLRHRFSRPSAQPPAQACLDRLTVLARALAGVDALDADAALAVVDELRAALAARSLIAPAGVLGGRPGLMRPPAGPAPAAGPLLAMPIGVLTAGQVEGEPVRYYLSTLVIDGGEAEVGYSAQLPPALLRHPGPGRRPAPMLHMRDTTATDDRGGTYRAGFSGGGSGGRWDGMLKFHPALPAGVRWLDITPAGAQTVRVDLTAVPPPLPVTSVALPTDSLAERYLDQRTLDLLRAGRREQAAGDEPEVVVMAAALLAAGALPADSPALGRLATAAAQAGVGLPASFAEVTPCALPPEWLAQLAPRDYGAGPAGMVPVAAVLPEVDGARCAIIGLRSEPDSATLLIEARGWPDPLPHGLAGQELFRWAVRDDRGRLYAAKYRGGGYGPGRASFRIGLHPAIDPRARELQVILTGKTGEVSVTVPLSWQEGV